jgi:hypothetical protein
MCKEACLIVNATYLAVGITYFFYMTVFEAADVLETYFRVPPVPE